MSRRASSNAYVGARPIRPIASTVSAGPSMTKIRRLNRSATMPNTGCDNAADVVSTVASNPASASDRLNFTTTSGNSGARKATWKSLRKWAAVAVSKRRRSIAESRERGNAGTRRGVSTPSERTES